jgi:hypothetical protein
VLLLLDGFIELGDLAAFKVGHVYDLDDNGLVVHLFKDSIQDGLSVHIRDMIGKNFSDPRKRGCILGRFIVNKIVNVLQVETSLTYQIIRLPLQTFHLLFMSKDLSLRL